MPSKARRFWLATHRYSGLAILLLLTFAGLTGSILCFMRPLDMALNADLFLQARSATTPAVAPLVERLRAAHPEWVVRSFPLDVPADRRIPVKVDAKGATLNQLFLDRESGALVGARSDKPAWNRRGAVQLLHDAHYTLLAGKTGRWIMSIVALAWLLSNLVGAYLTFPLRGPFWKQWRRTWRFSFKSSVPRLMLDLHRAPGLWLLLPATILAASSVGLGVFSDVYVPVIDHLFPEAPAPARTVVPPLLHPMDYSDAIARATAEARRDGERWQPATVSYAPAKDRLGVALTDTGKLNYHGLGPIYVYFDRTTGALVERSDPYRGDTNLALIRWLYPAHSGRTGGVVTITLVFVLGLAIALTSGTGIYVWWKKRIPRVAARKLARKRAQAA